MKTLSQTEIRALYGFAPNQEVIAFGRAVVNKPPKIVKHRTPTLDDYGTAEYNDHCDRRNKLRETPAVTVLESQVTELIF
jgi:hypothetical protein